MASFTINKFNQLAQDDLNCSDFTTFSTISFQGTTAEITGENFLSVMFTTMGDHIGAAGAYQESVCLFLSSKVKKSLS
ncbi:MAG: hypothetical protein LBE80_06560 [Deltaproteobacteria bacterium]|nr:hypothetical protein [Deltaproteobacteria bacterium]